MIYKGIRQMKHLKEAMSYHDFVGKKWECLVSASFVLGSKFICLFWHICLSRKSQTPSLESLYFTHVHNIAYSFHQIHNQTNHPTELTFQASQISQQDLRCLFTTLANIEGFGLKFVSKLQKLSPLACVISQNHRFSTPLMETLQLM